MKKLLAFLMASAMLAVCLTSCGPKGKTLEQIKSSKVLTVATSPDFPPFESIVDGNIAGIEVDILTAVCEKLGVELKLTSMDFDAVLPGIQAGKFNVGMSGISVTPEREKNTLFTDPYCIARQVIIVKDDSTIKNKADLTGKTISVQTGTTAEEYCTTNGYTVKAFSTNPDAASALTAGKVDAWVIDDLTGVDMVKSLEGVKILDEPMTTEPYAFAMAFGSETLRDEMNTIIKDMLADGTIKGIFEKYNAPYTSPSAS